MIRRIDAEVIDRAGAVVGEGPTWDRRAGCLVWVDILSRKVFLSAEDGSRLATYAVHDHVGAALPAALGGWLLATADGFWHLDADGTEVEVLAVEADRPDLRFNDAKCDPAGRAFAGTMRYDAQPGSGTLYRLDPGPVASVVLDGQGLCNGLGWSPDGTTFYFIDSLQRTVRAFPYDVATGEVGEASVLTEIREREGVVPDGLCVDEVGCLWVAVHGVGEVRRFQPDGTLDTIVSVPTDYPTSVAFGGVRGDRLFITTAGGRADEAHDDSGLAGGLFAVDPGGRGPAAVPWVT
jgi:sugar lactone lactonase YvrE